MQEIQEWGRTERNIYLNAGELGEFNAFVDNLWEIFGDERIDFANELFIVTEVCLFANS